MANKRSLEDTNSNPNNQQPKHKKPRLNKSETAPNETDNSNSSENEQVSVFQFINTLKVITFSKHKLIETKQKYSNQIQQREDALDTIQPAESLTPTDYTENNELISKHKQWSHALPSEILLNIFQFCVTNNETFDLIKTCKSWHDILMNIEPETPLLSNLFGPIICAKINRKGAFCWKDLALIPEKYLSIIGQIPSVYVEEFTTEENKNYHKLVAEGRGEEYINEEILSKDSNIPLLIQIVLHCPKLLRIELWGKLCHDIFVVLCNFGKNLDQISLEFCDGIDIMHWFDILGEAHVNENKLPKLKSIHVDRGRIQFDIGRFSSYFTQLEEVDLQKQYVDGDSLYLLFENCQQLINVTIWRNTSAAGDWVNAFKSLAKNKVIEYINIDSAEGFDNECCKLFLDKSICPKLNVFHLHYVPCSKKWIKKLEKQRANIDFYLCSF